MKIGRAAHEQRTGLGQVVDDLRTGGTSGNFGIFWENLDFVHQVGWDFTGKTALQKSRFFGVGSLPGCEDGIPLLPLGLMGRLAGSEK